MSDETEISLEGFQIISRDNFYSLNKPFMPSMTFWDSWIGFCKQDVVLLNGCESILLMIKPDTRQIIVMPTTSKDEDAIRWIKNKKGLAPRKMKCKKLTDKIYEIWGWDKECIYRAQGRMVTSSNKVMLLFDFSNPKIWEKPEAKTG